MQRNKNEKKNLIFQLILILCTGMFPFHTAYTTHPEDPIYCHYSHAITDKYCAEMAKNYKLYCYGYGGKFLKRVDQIDLSFNTVQNLNVAQARKLIIKCSEELLKRINADNDIKPYLSHYPFTEKGISLGVSFDQEDQKRVSSKFVAMVFTVDGNIYYSSYNHNKKKFQDVHEETYQEALKIVNNASKPTIEKKD